METFVRTNARTTVWLAVIRTVLCVMAALMASVGTCVMRTALITARVLVIRTLENVHVQRDTSEIYVMHCAAPSVTRNGVMAAAENAAMVARTVTGLFIAIRNALTTAKTKSVTSQHPSVSMAAKLDTTVTHAMKPVTQNVLVGRVIGIAAYVRQLGV